MESTGRRAVAARLEYRRSLVGLRTASARLSREDYNGRPITVCVSHGADQ